jgi:cytochrome c2
MSGDTWTYEALDGFIHDPRGYAPGTKMAYGGMRRDEQRADLLVYLRSLSDDPEPLPEPAAEEEDAAAEEAPAQESRCRGTCRRGGDGGRNRCCRGSRRTALHNASLASTPRQGESAARACQACHTFEEGGAHRVGPNLWNVVGRSTASA